MTFVKGQPNPKGRPSPNGLVVALARQQTESAIRTLTEIMLQGEKDSDRLAAAKAILDRAWGTAPATIELSGPQGGPIEYKNAREEFEGFITRIAERKRSQRLLPESVG